MIKGNSDIHFLNHFFLRFLPGSSTDYSTNTTEHSTTDQGAPDAYAAFRICFAVYDKFIIYNVVKGIYNRCFVIYRYCRSWNVEKFLTLIYEEQFTYRICSLEVFI